RAQYLDILTNTLFAAPVYKTYGKLIAEEHYTPADFKAELGYKDVGPCLERSPGAESAHAACELHLRPFPRAPCLARRRSRLLGAGASCQTRCRRGAAASVRMSRDAMAVRTANKSNAPEPPKDCPLCPRLVSFRHDNRTAHPDWFNGAVPSFGPHSAQLLIVGLAPGLKGANRTGRPFLGDYAGELLYPTLLKAGLARGRHDPSAPEAL